MRTMSHHPASVSVPRRGCGEASNPALPGLGLARSLTRHASRRGRFPSLRHQVVNGCMDQFSTVGGTTASRLDFSTWPTHFGRTSPLPDAPNAQPRAACCDLEGLNVRSLHSQEPLTSTAECGPLGFQTSGSPVAQKSVLSDFCPASPMSLAMGTGTSVERADRRTKPAFIPLACLLAGPSPVGMERPLTDGRTRGLAD